MSLAAKECVRRQYARHADAYVQSKTHASGDDLARLVAIVEPSSSDEALDIATGGGHIAAALAPLVKRVVASDLTAAMLDAAGRFFASKRLTNVRPAEADAEELPFADNSFDIVTCRIAPHHFPRPDRFVSEAARVLRPGGRFAVIDATVPPGAVGDWQNAFDKARDPSHVRALTVDAWIGLVQADGLDLRAVEHYPKRHEFVDWTARASVEPAAREALARHMLAAPAEVRETLQVERDGDRLIAFTDQKTLFYAVKTTR